MRTQRRVDVADHRIQGRERKPDVVVLARHEAGEHPSGKLRVSKKGDEERPSHPGIVMKQLTRFWLCSDRSSNVRTYSCSDRRSNVGRLASANRLIETIERTGSREENFSFFSPSAPELRLLRTRSHVDDRERRLEDDLRNKVLDRVLLIEKSQPSNSAR